MRWSRVASRTPTCSAAFVERASAIARAYASLYVRGTGKTSTARILAKAINCLDRRGAEPCGVCANCVEIGSGAAVDLIEIDAASNRGIDEIRDLRERVKYLPATLKVKVYIIDEAHMLTTEAFNALLKTLEEPPAHVVFVLATTEPHKIPLTVASRCQRFDFRRIDTGPIAAHLASIVEQEQVRVDPPSLALLARLARGSMRDGITLLDQLISQGGEELTVQKTHELLGLADPDTLVRLLAIVTEGDGAKTLGELQRFYDAGGDVRQLVRGLLGAIREAALLSVGYQDAESLGGAASAGLERIGRAAGRNALLSLWKGLMEMEPEVRKGADARLLLEVTLLSSMTRPIPVTVPVAAPVVYLKRGSFDADCFGEIKPGEPHYDGYLAVLRQTLANTYLAIDSGLELVPALNKIDLPSAEPERVSHEIGELLGEEPEGVLRISAKTGERLSILVSNNCIVVGSALSR